MVNIYTDGSALNNAKADARQAGCGYIIKGKKITIQRGYYLKDNTNNYAELFAIRAALSEALRHAEEFGEKTYNLITDSEYARKILTGESKPRVNLEIIEGIQKAMNIFKTMKFKLNIKHIEAHTKSEDLDSRFNDICDRMAKKCAKDQTDIPLKIIGAQ